MATTAGCRSKLYTIHSLQFFGQRFSDVYKQGSESPLLEIKRRAGVCKCSLVKSTVCPSKMPPRGGDKNKKRKMTCGKFHPWGRNGRIVRQFEILIIIFIIEMTGTSSIWSKKFHEFKNVTLQSRWWWKVMRIDTTQDADRYQGKRGHINDDRSSRMSTRLAESETPHIVLKWGLHLPSLVCQAKPINIKQ
jgi:hypothetical protein